MREHRLAPGGREISDEELADIAHHAVTRFGVNGKGRENPVERGLDVVAQERLAVAHNGFDAYIVVKRGDQGARTIPLASTDFREWLLSAHVARGKSTPRGERPRIFGALLDLAVIALRDQDESMEIVKNDEWPQKRYLSLESIAQLTEPSGSPTTTSQRVRGRAGRRRKVHHMKGLDSDQSTRTIASRVFDEEKSEPRNQAKSA